MTNATPSGTAVLLPGTGSDDMFVRSVFAAPLAAAGIRLIAPPPEPGPDLIPSSLAALDRAAEAAGEPILVGGISIGAQLGAEWAIRNRDRCAGLLLAMPAWTGSPTAAPAAMTALVSAELVREHGVAGALAVSCADVQPWLAGELTRTWHRHGDGLADGLMAAAVHPAPTLEQLAVLDLPTGIGACVDDPVHPLTVARTLAETMPRAAISETTLADLGVNRAALGRATVSALLRVTCRGEDPAH